MLIIKFGSAYPLWICHKFSPFLLPFCSKFLGSFISRLEFCVGSFSLISSSEEESNLFFDAVDRFLVALIGESSKSSFLLDSLLSFSTKMGNSFPPRTLNPVGFTIVSKSSLGYCALVPYGVKRRYV